MYNMIKMKKKNAELNTKIDLNELNMKKICIQTQLVRVATKGLLIIKSALVMGTIDLVSWE